MLKHADCDLANMLDDSSPPIDLDRVAISALCAQSLRNRQGPRASK